MHARREAYLVVGKRGEEVKSQEREDCDHQEENDNDIEDRTQGLQCVTERSMQKASRAVKRGKVRRMGANSTPYLLME